MHKKLVQTIEHSTVGSIKQVGPPVSYSDSTNAIRSAPPTVGQHTDQILKSILDMNDNQIDELRKKRVIM